MKKLTTRQIVIIIAILITIAGYYRYKAMHSNESSGKQPEPVAQSYNQQQIDKPDLSLIHKDTSEINDMVNVQVMFAKRGYQYCEFYGEYKGWEAKANKMDNEYYESHPDAPGIGAKKADRWLDNKISFWLKKHHLPDSISKTIAIYGNRLCNK